jgi:hypothetical protein
MTAGLENATDESKPVAPRRTYPRILRLPSFGFCCLATLMVCISFLGWIVIDAQYPTTVFVVRYSVGLQQLDPDPAVVANGIWDKMWGSVRSWDSLGPRLLLFAVLSISFAATFLVMLGHFGRRTTIRRMLMVLLSICAWLSLWASYHQLNEWAVLRRVKIALPRFKLAANFLAQDWPTENGRLPEAGTFYAYPAKHPNLLLLPGRKGYPIREDFGHQIERSDEGAIQFTLAGATDCQIEFHPDGSKPTSYSTSLTGNKMTLREAVQLKEHWFLVRYVGS